MPPLQNEQGIDIGGIQTGEVSSRRAESLDLKSFPLSSNQPVAYTSSRLVSSSKLPWIRYGSI